jgi:hypothetical protein
MRMSNFGMLVGKAIFEVLLLCDLKIIDLPNRPLFLKEQSNAILTMNSILRILNMAPSSCSSWLR